MKNEERIMSEGGKDGVPMNTENTDIKEKGGNAGKPEDEKMVEGKNKDKAAPGTQKEKEEEKLMYSSDNFVRSLQMLNKVATRFDSLSDKAKKGFSEIKVTIGEGEKKEEKSLKQIMEGFYAGINVSDTGVEIRKDFVDNFQFVDKLLQDEKTLLPDGETKAGDKYREVIYGTFGDGDEKKGKEIYESFKDEMNKSGPGEMTFESMAAEGGVSAEDLKALFGILTSETSGGSDNADVNKVKTEEKKKEEEARWGRMKKTLETWRKSPKLFSVGSGFLFFLIVGIGIQGWYAKIVEQMAERAR